MDWKILQVLQRDCSLPVHAIGEEVGLSSNACWRRIRRMEEDGVIAGRVALLDPATVGLRTTVFVAIRTNRHDNFCCGAKAPAACAGAATKPVNCQPLITCP